MTKDIVEAKQLEVHLARVNKYRDEGYTVIKQNDGSHWIYPKNAATGETDLTAMPTKLWAEPVETSDNTFAVPAPVDVDPDYSGEIDVDYSLRQLPDPINNQESQP